MPPMTRALTARYLTTVLGIIPGIGVGTVIAGKITRTLEQPFVQFDRSVSIPAWVLGAAITLLFTVLVNVIALRPVKNLKLTDAAQAVAAHRKSE